ncbi:glutaredoxin family protein [Nocardia abscessus]|uniref:glutaredoxin family protein n=1 Tax=Nocardia abscessus TaxID=120957 RepID=UPI00313EFDF0
MTTPPPPITVYGKPACPQCHTTRSHLDKLGVPYTYRDVTEDDDSYAAVAALGYLTLPVVTVGDLHWTGYRHDKLKQLAKIHHQSADITELDTAAERYITEADNA